jgi:Flp pilus assembly protein protease CpaA
MQDKSLIFLKYLTIIMGTTLTIGVIILIKLIFNQTKISTCDNGQIVIAEEISDIAVSGKKVFIVTKEKGGTSKISYFNYCEETLKKGTYQ